MSWEIHAHRGAAKILSKKQREEIECAIARAQAHDIRKPAAMRRVLLDELYLRGWPRRVPLATTQGRLTISSLKRRTGLCAQFGNFARSYADLLKLEALNRAGQIDVGALIVPTESLADQLGSNLARFERLRRELAYFHDVLECPLLLYGVRPI